MANKGNRIVSERVGAHIFTTFWGWDGLAECMRCGLVVLYREKAALLFRHRPVFYAQKPARDVREFVRALECEPPV